MQLHINGEAKNVSAVGSVQDLLAVLGLNKGQAVAVEVNKECVPKKLHPQHKLNEGDRVEIVTLVPGG